MKLIAVFLIFSIFLMSCSTIDYSQLPSDKEINFDEINTRASKNNSTITLLNGEIIKAEFLVVNGDSLIYHAEDTMSISLSEIEKIEIKDWIGAVTGGIIFGIFVTIVVGSATFMLVDASQSDKSQLSGIVGLISGITATVLGILDFGESEFIFNDKNEKEENDLKK